MREVFKFLGRATIAGCATFTFFDIFGYPVTVKGASMYPTLEGSDSRWFKNDIVWVTSFGARTPRIGDVLTFTAPRDPKAVHIKRVTATERQYVRPRHRPTLEPVPPGCLWMESDNQANANDSNVYGPVSLGLVRKRAICVMWPPNRWRLL